MCVYVYIYNLSTHFMSAWVCLGVRFWTFKEPRVEDQLSNWEWADRLNGCFSSEDAWETNPPHVLSSLDWKKSCWSVGRQPLLLPISCRNPNFQQRLSRKTYPRSTLMMTRLKFMHFWIGFGKIRAKTLSGTWVLLRKKCGEKAWDELEKQWQNPNSLLSESIYTKRRTSPINTWYQ